MYGSTKEQVFKNLKNGFNVLFDIDWQGAQQIKKQTLDYKLISFFILPPSKEILLEVAVEVGMDLDTIKLFLDSKEGGQETADEEMNFIEKSIGAVPTYFINEKYIIQGGQEPETFISFLNKILIKEKENATTR